MTNYQRLSLLLMLCIVVATLIFLAGALPSLTFEAGESFGFGDFILERLTQLRQPTEPVTDGGSGSLVWAARCLFWVGLPLAIIYSIVSPEGRRRLLRMLPIFIGILLLAYALNRIPREPQQQEIETPPMGGLPGQGFSMPPTPEFIANPPPWLLITVNALIGLLIAGAIWFIWRLFQRRKVESPQAHIVKEAERALIDLQAGKDFRNTIIQCYAAMSRVLKRDRHIARRRGMTVREFEAHLASTGIDDEYIHRLTRLFEGVRYGGNETRGRDEREAMDCLNAIIKAYGSSS
jgi:hypothetical protein